MKREIRKIVRFTPAEWRTVSERADALKMKKCTFLRRIALCKEWKIFEKKRIAEPLKTIGSVGSSLTQMCRIAEETNSPHLEKLKTLRQRYNACREKLMKYYSELL